VTELAFTKTISGGVAPADEATQEVLRKAKVGAVFKGDYKLQRNPAFHRKVFALFKFAFDMWDAPQLEYRGQPVAKSFDRFRKDLTILAGHYHASVNLREEVRLEPKSLAFGSMAELEFEEVYRDILGVVWDKVLKAKGFADPASVDRAVEELLRFEA